MISIGDVYEVEGQKYEVTNVMEQENPDGTTVTVTESKAVV